MLCMVWPIPENKKGFAHARRDEARSKAGEANNLNQRPYFVALCRAMSGNIRAREDNPLQLHRISFRLLSRLRGHLLTGRFCVVRG